jgi:predicted MFS family arabinose efflux permease
LTAILSAGSVLGSFSVGLLRHPRRIYLASAATAFGVGMVATAEARSVAVASVALAFTGFAAFSFVTLTSTTLQLHAAPSYRARIMALFGLFYLGTTPIGTTLAGWVSGSAGAPAALLMGAGACFAAAVLAFLVHTPPHPDEALVDLTPPVPHL